jgi:hypothetical protein
MNRLWGHTFRLHLFFHLIRSPSLLSVLCLTGLGTRQVLS